MAYPNQIAKSVEDSANSIELKTLDPRPIELIKPIVAGVDLDHGCHIASFSEANISGSGESQADAIEMLKDVIASTYRLLTEKESILGTEPARQLSILRKFVRAK